MTVQGPTLTAGRLGPAPHLGHSPAPGSQGDTAPYTRRSRGHRPHPAGKCTCAGTRARRSPAHTLQGKRAVRARQALQPRPAPTLAHTCLAPLAPEASLAEAGPVLPVTGLRVGLLAAALLGAARPEGPGWAGCTPEQSISHPHIRPPHPTSQGRSDAPGLVPLLGTLWAPGLLAPHPGADGYASRNPHWFSPHPS